MIQQVYIGEIIKQKQFKDVTNPQTAIYYYSQYTGFHFFSQKIEFIQ